MFEMGVVLGGHTDGASSPGLPPVVTLMSTGTPRMSKVRSLRPSSRLWEFLETRVRLTLPSWWWGPGRGRRPTSGPTGRRVTGLTRRPDPPGRDDGGRGRSCRNSPSVFEGPDPSSVKTRILFGVPTHRDVGRVRRLWSLGTSGETGERRGVGRPVEVLSPPPFPESVSVPCSGAGR